MRKFAEGFWWESYGIEGIEQFFLLLFFGDLGKEDGESLRDDVGDIHAWREGAEGVLKDDLDKFLYMFPFFSGEGERRDSVDMYGSLGVDESCKCEGKGAFP